MRGFVVVVSSFWLFVVSASAGLAAGTSRGAEVLRLMGFDVAISGFADEVKNNQTGVEIDDPAFRAARDELADRLFDPDLLFNTIAAIVDTKFNAAEYDALESYFSEGVGLRVTEAEKYAQAPENQAERDAATPGIIEDLLANNPERMDQIGQLIDAMDVVGTGTAMAMNLGYAMVSGMASTGKLPGGVTDAQILAMLNARRDQIEAEVYNKSVISAAYTYRDISNADMDDYLSFLQSDLGQKLYNVLENAQVDVLTAASRKYGHDLMLRAGGQEL